ncbi:MAG: SPOR domain-containing protein [Rhodospirillaceae bacterium]|nr:SPOR domain-containing protein [Rhodospirillaceae bacterium]
MPLRFVPQMKAAFLLTTIMALSGCASLSDGALFPSFGSGDDDKAAAIATQPVDPLDVDPLTVDAASAQTASASGGSQMVPLGTLNANDMNAAPGAAPKRNGPAPLIPAGAQAAAPAPQPTAPQDAAPQAAAPQATASQTPPAQAAPVLTPPPGMTAQNAAAPPPQVTVAQPETLGLNLPRQNVTTSAAKAAAVTARAPVMPATPAQPDAQSPLAQLMAPPGATPMADAREFNPQPAMPSQAAGPVQSDAREFVPAQISMTEPMVNGGPGAPKLTVGDSNVIRRFQILSKLLDEGLITQEEHDRRRAANIGALLQYSKEPPGLGLDRPVPAPAAISARLQALGRSLEMRAITTRQHEMERMTILNSLLPEKPDPRAPKAPPPSDMFALADSAGRLAYIRDQDLISEGEFTAEKAAMDRVMRGGEGVQRVSTGSSSSSASGATAGAKSAANAKAANAAANPAAPADAGAPQALSGPVLHLASFRSAEGARSGYEQAKTRNPNLFANLRFEARKTNVPGQGNFYRLLVGPFGSMAEAEAACVEMKKVDQFCRPTPDGS